MDPACLPSTPLLATLRAQMREVVYEFYGSRYAACLARLQRLLPLLLLDLHLAPHVVHLYQQARTAYSRLICYCDMALSLFCCRHFCAQWYVKISFPGECVFSPVEAWICKRKGPLQYCTSVHRCSKPAPAHAHYDLRRV